MNSGGWDKTTGRVRPGTYINLFGVTKDSVSYGTRGVVAIPLIGHNWGPNHTVVTITTDDITKDAARLGDSPVNILLLNEALKGAGTVRAYIINKGTEATGSIELKAASGDDPAVVLSATAKYGGTRGNDLKVASVMNTDGTFDITVYLGTEAAEEFTGLAKVSDLISAGSVYIDFSCEKPDTPLIAFASASLTGAVDGTVLNSDISTMLDNLEGVSWNTLAFPNTEAALQAMVISKVRYLRDTIGKSVQAVLPNANTTSADYEGVINLINSVVLEDGTVLTTAQATAWVAAATAAADETQSNTYKVYPGADAVSGVLSNEAIEAAIGLGQMCFTSDADQSPHIEYDINSLHTFTTERPKQYSKNKVVRIVDSLCDAIRGTFPPNAFPNNQVGWDRMDSLGKTILQRYDENGGNGAIRNVNYDEDFLVDREISKGDSVYVDVAITPVDAAEKLYFTVLTR